MAKPKTQEPVTLSVIRRGKTNSYQLADAMDWAVIFDTVLEIKSIDPAGRFYWPLDSVTLWKVTPLSLSGHA